MSDCVRYPAPGCVVEYLEGNAVQIALITEEAGGRLRLLLPNRRETRLNASRLLPWLGPLHGADLGRDEAVRLLEQHKKCREDLASDVPVMDVWEMAQGEVSVAPATWFAELFTSDPSADQVSAYGRALLACKSHFRFQPPDFQVFPADMVEKRLVEEKNRLEREALIAGGAAFLRMLWDVACRKRELPPPPVEGASSGEWPSADVAESLEEVLRGGPRSVSISMPAGSKTLEVNVPSGIREGAKLRLAGQGVERVFGGNFCTVTEADRFFSYRRDGQTGRMASMIWLTPRA